MKYLTMAWWKGVQRGEDYNPFPEYNARLDEVRDKLPADLLELQESFCLHDALLRKFTYLPETNRLELVLDGDDGNGGLRTIVLNYLDLASFQSVTDPDLGFSGAIGYGDLGYYEVDITEEGLFEHRILFSTGIEFHIVFGGFSWTKGEPSSPTP